MAQSEPFDRGGFARHAQRRPGRRIAVAGVEKYAFLNGRPFGHRRNWNVHSCFPPMHGSRKFPLPRDAGGYLGNYQYFAIQRNRSGTDRGDPEP